ncbi:MAG: UDP-N-acetylmuramoyl-tripeptide--D-alanyl-D-alanine ligase [Prolixibacteraceae bacterium]
MKSIEEIYELFLQHPFVFTDSRLAARGGIFFALKGEQFDGNAFALQALLQGAHFAVVDQVELAQVPGCIWVQNVLKALQDLANFHRRMLTIPVLAITGTNGKTTTKELIANVLSQKFNVLSTNGNLNNHIGVPLTLLSINSSHDIAVIEMGANHLEEIDFLCKIAEPDYGLITNVGKAHLEGFGSFEGVKQTKSELYRFIANKGKAIFINIDNEDLVGLAAGNVKQYTYAVHNEKAQLLGEAVGDDLFVVAKVLFDKGWLYLKSKLTGKYNLENILAAVRIGLFFGLDPLLIQQGVEAYEPTNKRSQIMQKDSATILLDCYNANPSSMHVSILNFMQIKKSGKVMVLGDMLELGDASFQEHQKIIDSIALDLCEQVILVGSNFMETNAPDTFIKLKEIEEIKTFVNKDWAKNKFILVKGSRGIRLEKLLEWI